MDVVTLQAAKRNAAALAAGHFALVTNRMQVGNESVVWANLGDSTGVAQDFTTDQRWVYLTALRLGTMFSAYTVNYRAWNDTNQNYDALGAGGSVVIQTGTGTANAGGPYVLDVYNGSTSGQLAVYSTTRITLQVPVTPHLITVNYGHNEGGNLAYRGPLYDLTRRLEDYFPSAGLVVIGQNPRVSPATNITAHLTRIQQAYDLCGSENYGFVNVTQAFLNTAGYASLINVDGVHPTAAGSTLWASVVGQLLAQSLITQPRAMVARPHRIWMPASAFAADEGPPTLSVTGPAGAHFAAWALDPATQQGVVASLDFPDSWQTINVYLVWVGPTGSGYTGSTNSVRWGTSIARLPTTGPFPSPAANTTVGTPNNYADTLTSSTVSNSGAYTHVIHRAISGVGFAYRPLHLRVHRIAADVNDTLAENALLRGVYIERAS